MYTTPTLLTLLTLLAASSATAFPNPFAAPLEYTNISARDYTLTGDLPNNVAKVWAFTHHRCDFDDGPSYMWTVMPGTDKCILVKNVGSVFVWKLNNAGEGTCMVTVHSGSDCRGISWTPNDRRCAYQNYASIRVTCPNH